MAASFTCDGCGASVEVPMVVGHVLKRDYCEECAKKAQAFVTAEEQLRISVQSDFATGRQGLIAFHGSDGFKLPDVP